MDQRRPTTLRSWTAAISSLAAAGALLAATAPAHAAPPANDNFASAQVVPSGGGSFAATNVDATSQANEPHMDDFLMRGRATIWYAWTAPSASEVTINACTGAPGRMVLAVYTKFADPVPPFTNLEELGAVGEGGDPGGCTGEYGAAGVLDSPVAGRTYYFQIAGWAGTPGNQGAFTLTVTPVLTTPPPSPAPPPANKGKKPKKCKKKGKKGRASAAKSCKKAKKKK